MSYSFLYTRMLQTRVKHGTTHGTTGVHNRSIHTSFAGTGRVNATIGTASSSRMIYWDILFHQSGFMAVNMQTSANQRVDWCCIIMITFLWLLYCIVEKHYKHTFGQRLTQLVIIFPSYHSCRKTVWGGGRHVAIVQYCHVSVVHIACYTVVANLFDPSPTTTAANSRGGQVKLIEYGYQQGSSMEL